MGAGDRSETAHAPPRRRNSGHALKLPHVLRQYVNYPDLPQQGRSCTSQGALKASRSIAIAPHLPFHVSVVAADLKITDARPDDYVALVIPGG